MRELARDVPADDEELLAGLDHVIRHAPDAKVRLTCLLFALAHFPDRPQTRRLTRTILATEDGDVPSRLAAAASLDDEGVETLQEIATTGLALQRLDALRALERIDREAILPEHLAAALENFRGSRVFERRLIDLLERLGELGEKNLLRLIRNRDSETERRAIVALAKVGALGALTALLPLALDENHRHSIVAGEVLCQVYLRLGHTATGHLQHLATSAPPELRVCALRVLPRYDVSEATRSLLVATLDARNAPQVVTAAIAACRRIGVRAIEPQLLALLEFVAALPASERDELRLEAVRALAEVGGREAVEPLLALGEATNTELRLAAAVALEEVRERLGPGHPGALSVVAEQAGRLSAAEAGGLALAPDD